MIAALLASASTSANAASLLLGSVAFDAGSLLYTYSYTVDNSAGSSATDDFGVLIASGVEYPLFNDFAASTSPPGWHQVVSVGGPDSVFGTFFEWFNDGPCLSASACTGVQPGESQSGFSVTLPFAPSGSLADNYYIFLPFADNQFPLGNVVSPAVPTPLPASLFMLLGGLAAFGLIRGRRPLAPRAIATA
jgi:hypothetical protein